MSRGAADRLRDANPYVVDPSVRAQQQEQQEVEAARLAKQRQHDSIGGGTFDTLSKEARAVSNWLLLCSGIVFTIVVVGGITRLTESGLSIVEWRPVAGLVPPMSQKEWEAEFAKYQKYPEYAQNPHMDLAHFKYIFFWEWAHRVLARSVGVVFAVPMVYFMARGYLRRRPILYAALLGLLALGGAQGALGWYMVKSGLDPKLVEQKKKATVSAYRLAAHLSLALVLYASMMRLALAIRVTPKMVADAMGASSGTQSATSAAHWWDIRLLANALALMLGGTIVSGAFVAGLDAGLLFNDEFPLMMGGVFPPPHEVITLGSDAPLWRNFTENPVAAQVWHRVMAGFTVWMVFSLNFMMRYKRMRAGKADLPKPIVGAVRGVTHAIVFQALLGFATILLSVPISVAALHQANSVIALTMVLRLLSVLSTRGAMRL